MREAVEKVLNAENDARRMIAEAEQQAKNLRNEAQNAGRACMDAARLKAETKAATLIQTAAANAELDRQNILENARGDAARFMEQANHIPDSVVALLARKTGGLEL